jgi:hypothetical protein
MPFCLPRRSPWLAVALAKAAWRRRVFILPFVFVFVFTGMKPVNYETRKTAVPAVMADGLLACRFI